MEGMSLNYLTFLFLFSTLRTVQCRRSDNLTCSLSKRDRSQISKWNKSSVCMTEDEVTKYYCKTLEYDLDEWINWKSNIVHIGDRVSSALGLLGSAFTVWLLFSPKTRHRFKGISFGYLKIIAVLELVEKVAFTWKWIYKGFWSGRMLIMDALVPLNRLFSKGTTMYVDVITLGMGIERVVCLLMPSYFSMVNSYKFLLAVNLMAVLIVSLSIPRIIEKVEYIRSTINRGGKCCKGNSMLWSDTTRMIEDVKDVILMIVTILVLLTSIAVIAGLIKQKKNRDKLLGRGQKGTTDRKKRGEAKERQKNIRLSILLLALAVPVVTYGTVRIFDGYFNRNIFYGKKAVEGICYKEAMDGLKWAVTAEILDLIQDLSFRVAHDSNFYLYILFFIPFREALLQMFGKKYNQIQPTTTKGNRDVTSRPNGASKVAQSEHQV